MNRSTFLLLSLTVLFFLSAAQAETSTDDDPGTIFMYAFAGVNPLAGKSSNGLILDYLMERADRKSDPDADVLFDALAETTPRARFTPTLACIYRSEEGLCPEIEFLAENPLLSRSAHKDFYQELVDRGLSKAKLVVLTEQAFQGGYALHAGLHEISLWEKGFERELTILTSYDEPFNKASDASSRGLSEKDRKAVPKLGSKEARALWWHAGDPPRIERLTTEGLQVVTELLSLGYAFADGKTIDELEEELESRKRVRDLDFPEGKKCRLPLGLCKARVLQYDEERVIIASISQVQLNIGALRFENVY